MTTSRIRNQVIKIRLTNDERTALTKVAFKKGLPVSAWMRALALAAALAGCSYHTTNERFVVIADLGQSDADHVADAGKMIQADESHDLMSMPVDMSQSEPADFAQAMQPDLAEPAPDLRYYTNCTDPGQPTGGPCKNNTECCHGLCTLDYLGNGKCN